MIPLLTYPLALLAAVSLPALVTIYLFRNRFRRRQVSGLFLWDSALRTREGGTVIRRMRTSWLFALELLALLALTLAATDPRAPYEGARRACVVVLDDSASMSSGAPEASPRDRALTALRRTVRRERFRAVRYVLAGERPGLVDVGSDAALAAAWRCRAPRADLDAALMLALQLAGDRGQVLVLTDRPPPVAPAPGQVRWEAFGDGEPNLGFIEARRASSDGRDRLFVEVGNYAAENRSVELALVTADRRVQTVAIEAPAGGTAPTALTLPPGTGAVDIRLPDDALAIDNRVTLLPDAPRPVGVRVDVADAEIRRWIEAGLAAAGLADLAAPPDLVVTDRADAEPDGAAWVLRVVAPTGAVAYAGPFVVDREHPLTEGLSFDGAVWGGGAGATVPGTPVILAGNEPLLCVQTPASGRWIIDLRFVPAISTMQRTPAWPGLLWNILHWRSQALPGVERVNVHAGGDVRVTAPAGTVTVVVDGPDGARVLEARGGVVVAALPTPGRYGVAADAWRCELAANFCASGESDLRGQRSGAWGDWHATEVLTRDYASWAWPAALAALLALAVHTALIGRSTAGSEAVE